jgi:DNA-binding transcriptional MocR family regulator
MTWRLIGPIWRLPDISSMERLVLLALASFTDRRGENSYPALGTLAKMCSCNRSTVHRSIKSLIARQLIEPTGKGRKGTIRYKVNVPMQQRVLHNAPPTVGTVPHNPKYIPINKNPSNNRDSNLNFRNPPALNIDRFSNVKLPESGAEIAIRLQREREARRKR